MTASEFAACLEASGRTVRQRGASYWAQCSGHDDHSPSLKIDNGQDGHAVLCCHSRHCDSVAILDGLGLSWREFYGDTRRPPVPIEQRREARRLEVAPGSADAFLEALREAGVPYRATEDLDRWRALCPVCEDPRLSVWIIEPGEGREGEPVLVFCATGCSREAIDRALARGLEAAA